MSTRVSLIYRETDGFKRDFKKLLKKFRTLESDLETAKKSAIQLLHIQKIDTGSIFKIPGFSALGIEIYKLKKFACRALKGKGANSGIRIIYAFQAQSNTVAFLEMYFKADQANEDRNRIKTYLNLM